MEKPKCRDICDLLNTLLFIQRHKRLAEKCFSCSALMKEGNDYYCALALMKLPNGLELQARCVR